MSPSRLHPAVVIGMAVFSVWFGISAWFRHANFVTSTYDLGNMDQVIWQTLHGHPFSLSSPNRAVLEPRAAIHTDFLLLSALPTYVVWPSPVGLMWLQILMVASGAVPVYWLARRRWSVGWSCGFAIGYLAYPVLQWATIFDVHAIVMATPLLLWAWWAAVTRRWRWYWAAVALSLLAKEEVGFVIAAMGLYGWWAWPAQRRTALLTIIVGLGWTTAMLGWVIPTAREAPGHFALEYFADFGETPSGVIGGLVTQPEVLLGRLANLTSLGYLSILLWPVAFAPLFAWPILLIMAPTLLINLLSANGNLQSIYFHYTSTLTPFIFIAAVEGGDRMRRWWEDRPAIRRVAPALIGLVVLAAIWTWAPLPLTRHHRDALHPFAAVPEASAVKHAAAGIPSDASVAVTNNLGPHFTQREKVWLFPHYLESADAAVILQSHRTNIVTPVEMDRAILELRRHPSWRLRLQTGRFWWFERIAPDA